MKQDYVKKEEGRYEEAEQLMKEAGGDIPRLNELGTHASERFTERNGGGRCLRRLRVAADAGRGRR